MDLLPTLFSTGWASGVNAYGTVAMLGILGRAGVGEVPEPLQSDPAIVLSLVMFAIEFVTDKVPLLDSTWDVIHTAVRPAIGGAIGALFGTDAGLSGFEEVVAAGGTGVTALASHAVKAGIRLGINTSPEPVTNIVTSLAEDGVVAVVVLFALEEPMLAALIAAVLLVTGAGLVLLISSRIKRGIARVREQRRAQSSNSA